MLQHRDYKDVVVLCSRGEWPWSMNRNEKQTVAWEWLDSTPSVCARFILARLNFDSESSASHDEMRLLNLFATQSNKSNNIMINFDVCLEVLPWLVNSCLHRMVNQLESWKLKLESKDLLFIAFQQKENQSLTEPCIVKLKWATYTRWRLSLAEY